jgi:hypothetical protein
VREYFGKFGCDSTIFVSYGRRKKEEGRRKINWFPGSGWEPRARGSASRAKKTGGRARVKCLPSQSQGTRKNYFLQNLPAPKTDYPPAAKAPIIAIDKAKPGNSSNPNIKASCPLITFS